MPSDRFVYTKEPVTLETVRADLREFMSGVGHEQPFAHNVCRMWWRLPGDNQNRMRKLEPNHPDSKVRMIEVFVSERSIDVMTRDQDECVDALADGFARRMARAYGSTPDFER